MGQFYISIGGTEVPIPIGQSAAFATYNSGVTYTSGQVAIGSDGNLYRAVVSTTGNDPTIDAGANWKLWMLQSSMTLNCGVNQRFADTFAASSSPGGAMTPGMNSAFTFIQSAVGSVSPIVATITIQQSNNPTFTASANGTTTTILTSVNIPIGASLLAKSGTTGNIGKTTTVTASSYSTGTYTLTVGALSASTASGDVFVYAPLYGTTIAANLPQIGSNVIVLGSTSTPTLPTNTVSVSANAGGGSLSPIPYYIAVTYTYTDPSGTTRETQPGPVTSQTASGGGTLTIAGFTLPSGISGANVYASTSSGGTLYKQGSMSVSGGSTTAYTMSSFNAVTAAPTANPAAATYPCTLNFGNVNGISLASCNSIELNGLYVLGPSSSSGYVGVTVGYQNGASVPTTSLAYFGTAMVISKWSYGVQVLAKSYLEASNSQFDSCTDGLFANNFSAIRALNVGLPRNTTGAVIGQQAWGNLQSANVAFCSTGFLANYGGNIETLPANPASGTIQNTYGCTTAASPAFNTNGNSNGYISNT